MRLRSRRVRASTTGLIAAALVAALLAPIAAASPLSAQSTTLHGRVVTGATALEGFDVTLYATSGGGGPPDTLATATTAADGTFDLSYEAPANAGAVLYLLASNTTPPPDPGAVTLASVLGRAPIPADVVVNERTTVASAYAMTQFTENGALAGRAPGLQNAAGMVRNLVDLSSGDISPVLAGSPNGSDTSTRETFNSLANMIAACIASPGTQCPALFGAATPPGKPAPANTFQAMVDINLNPWQNVPTLMALSSLPPAPYQPARSSAPDAWTLALRFVGDGVSMDGPGNIAIDHEGSLWVTNNYEFKPTAVQPVCGAENLLRFSPTGEYVAGSPYTGGGLSGAGFGIDIDPFGDVWVANFGFAAPPPDCPEPFQPVHNTVSQVRHDGTPVSPGSTARSGAGGGYTQGGIAFPQGTVSDDQGNIWIANCQGDSVTQYPGGDPNRAQELTDIGVSKPFGVARTTSQDIFVTGVASDTVAELRPDGSPAPGSPFSGGGLSHPLGVAVDSRDNAWVANSGFVDIPCPQVNVGSLGGSVTLIANGQPTNFTGGGLTIPWGIAVDGNDTVWVANFAGKRLSQFCGADPSKCPAGFTTGQAISPAVSGYGFDGLVRNTGVAVDPSGNVWLCNNWKEVPIQANPGGYEIVTYVGVAAPVTRPAPRPRPQQTVPRFTG